MAGILVLGAGRSSHYLLHYLAEVTARNAWQLIVADRDESSLRIHAGGLSADLKVLDVSDPASLDVLMETTDVDLVVSLLPPSMHPMVAGLCLKHGLNLATASYVSREMQAYHQEASAKGLVFLNEMGLDPGIDHLSAMKAIDEIRDQGGEIHSFESYCGGLVHEDDCGANPWKYKFSWNPRNVVTAAQGGLSVYRRNGGLRCLPWHRVFAHAETLEIPGHQRFDAYANRDSLGYEKVYGLETANTLVRGTLRRPGYCRAWQVLVQLGYTDAQSVLPDAVRSMADLSAALTGKSSAMPFEDWLTGSFPEYEDLREHFAYLGMDDPTPLDGTVLTAADILQQRLMKRWMLEPQDRDEVVMYHRIGYRKQGVNQVFHAVLKLAGEDAVKTAMAKTVGLPLAMGAELILEGRITQKGVVIPVTREWYHPVLSKLESRGIVFAESLTRA